MKNIEELRESAAERIFLVPVSECGDIYYCWCDDPAPSEGMIASEAVEYVRADVVQTLRGQLEESERRRDELADKEDLIPGLKWAISRCESLQRQGFTHSRNDVLSKDFQNCISSLDSGLDATERGES